METHIGPAGRPSSEHILFQCNICLVSKPMETFPFMPCCSNKRINRDACASCVATALTIPTDNKCPRCREYVQLVGTVTSQRPPYRIVDVDIELGAIEQCVSCGEMKRLIHPSRVCKDCHRFKEGVSDESVPKLLYECQVCHDEQIIPYPIYKTQRTPRHYGNPAWWLCNNTCGGKARRWRIVATDVRKLETESAPHSWAQYFIRKELNCLPQDPARITIETNLNSNVIGSMAVDMGPGRFVADEVDPSGNSFLVPCQQFPIAESLEDDNDEWLDRKTTLRLLNERSGQIYAVLAHWLPNGFVHCRSIPPEESKPAESSDDQFQEDDWLVAVDYLPLLMRQTFSRAPFWSRQEFSIQQTQTLSAGSLTPFLGWNVQPYNVRIGKIGIFVGGNEKKLTDSEEHIILDINVDYPVTALWTDAVHLSISLLEPTDSGNSQILGDVKVTYPIPLLPDDKHPSIRRFPDGTKLQGSLRVQFSSVSYKSLQGLASPIHGGGLHLALLTESSPTSDDVLVKATEPPHLIEKPSFTVEELQASSSVAHLRNEIRNLTLNEKRRRFMELIVDESHRELFENNVVKEGVDAVLEPMLENEDFVRRYMRSSSKIENDDFGWIDPNSKEDSTDTEDERRRPSFALAYEGSRLLVQDPPSSTSANRSSGNTWLSSTVRAVRDSFRGFGSSANSSDPVPKTSGARVEMDGLHVYDT